MNQPAAADLPASRHSGASDPPRSILVKEVNWLGDLVMSLPALRALRDAYPAARLAVLVKADLAGFFDGISWVDEVICYPRGLKGVRDKLKLVRDLRTRDFEVAVHFPNSFESALWMALARIPRRAGYNTEARGLLLTDRVAPSADAREGHQSRYWLGLLRDALNLDVNLDTCEAGLEVGHEHQQEMRRWLDTHRMRRRSPLIAIAPIAAYGSAKEWPHDRYATLIDLLATRYDAECVIVGASDDRPRCERIARAAHTQPLIAAGEISLGQLIAMLSLCDGFAGNDSGAMHLAAAVGIPTVGIFGSTNPARTGPLGPSTRILRHPLPCSPCLARDCRFGHYNCLGAITPAAVLEALDGLGVFTSRK